MYYRNNLSPAQAALRERALSRYADDMAALGRTAEAAGVRASLRPGSPGSMAAMTDEEWNAGLARFNARFGITTAPTPRAARRTRPKPANMAAAAARRDFQRVMADMVAFEAEHPPRTDAAQLRQRFERIVSKTPLAAPSAY